MRVLSLIVRRQLRGAEVFAMDLASALVRSGCPTRVVALYGDPRDSEENGLAIPDGVPFGSLGGRAEGRMERIAVSPSLLSRLRDEIGCFEPDIVQVNGSRTVKYGALARRLDRRAGWKLVYRNIGDPRIWLANGWKRRIYRAGVGPALDGVVAVSRMTAGGVRDLYGDSIPIVRIPRGVEVEKLEPTQSREAVRASLKTPAGAPVVLFVGNLSPEKRIDRWLRVFAACLRQRPDLVGWVLGDGSEADRARSVAEELGVVSNVRFLGSRSNPASWLCAADVLLLTSDTEGTPGVVLEAGIASLAVVATRVGGTEECIGPVGESFLRDPEDEEGLRDAVVELVDDEARRVGVASAAATWTAERFEISRVAARYVQFYEELLGDRSSP